MNLGTTLASVEKKFGPAVAGVGSDETTFSALRIGKGGKYAGVPGKRDDAVFYIHFPLSVDWKQLATKKGTPDFINNLSTSGPQGEQGRENVVAEFLKNHETKRAAQEVKTVKEEQKRLAAEEKHRSSILKEEQKRLAAEKKRLQTEANEKTRLAREKMMQFEGERHVVIEIEAERFEILVTIKIDKRGKVKLSGTF